MLLRPSPGRLSFLRKPAVPRRYHRLATGGQRLYIWDYTPNFAHYQQPFPNFDALQPNVQFFVKHGVSGLFEQGNYSGGGAGEMGPLRAYLLAKLLWNPNTDLARHRTEFLGAYYGKAAPKIQAYLDLIHTPAREQGAHAHIYDPPRAAYLTDTVVGGGAQLLDEAEQMAENDAVRFSGAGGAPAHLVCAIEHGRVKDAARLELLRRFMEVAAGLASPISAKAEAWRTGPRNKDWSKADPGKFMQAGIEIVALSRQAAGVRRFLRASYGIYGADPNWVAPLLHDQAKVFYDTNPFFAHAQMQLWVATRQGRDVGASPALWTASISNTRTVPQPSLVSLKPNPTRRPAGACFRRSSTGPANKAVTASSVP